jgi:hypothetical protein
MSLFHVLSFHHSSMLSIRSHRVSSSTPYISYFPPSKVAPSLFATSIAALFSPLLRIYILFGKQEIQRVFTHFNNSSSSWRSGKNNLGSKTANIPSAARYRNESPSNSITSHIRAQASNGRWSKNNGMSQSGR